MRILLLIVLTAATLFPADEAVIQSLAAGSDFALTLDPNSAPWKGAASVFIDKDREGNIVAGHRMEFRSVWTEKNLYFLYIAPYETLNLHPNPSTTTETMKLWDWDVAELFISAEPNHLRHYYEFQVSPQGEWIDLDINRENPLPETWRWNSGFEVKARIDHANKIWYGAMRIPWSSIDKRPAAAGNELHISVCRIQGTGPDDQRKRVVWLPGSFHRPANLIRLVK